MLSEEDGKKFALVVIFLVVGLYISYGGNFFVAVGVWLLSVVTMETGVFVINKVLPSNAN